jgi:hypothetical protein
MDRMLITENIPIARSMHIIDMLDNFRSNPNRGLFLILGIATVSLIANLNFPLLSGNCQ